MWVHTLLSCFVGLVSYLIARRIWWCVPSPPGPPGWPLIGNLLDFRTRAPYKSLGAMSDKYGPIISLNVLGTQCVVLNSFKATRDLLEKRSAVTANRPHLTVAGDLVGWGNATPFLQYGDTHRKHRKFYGKHIRTNCSLAAFYPSTEAEAKRFVLNLLKDPGDLIAHCRGTIASLILKISHGYTVKEDGDPLVEMADRALLNISESMTPGRFLADFLPFLRYFPEWFPGCGFHKEAREWRKMVNEAVNSPYEFVLEHLEKGDAAPSLTSRVLQEGITADEEQILRWTSFGMYLAGADMTPSTLSAFFLAVTMYPEILKRAQAEVDSVVGSDRLPTMEDRDALPYVNAVCTELLRWTVLAPIPSHVATQDIIYEGYSIPKGSWLVPNIWFILSDPITYPDPDAFDPERFLGNNQQPDPREACFGWGRRACPGANLAESVIFIYIAVALATLDVSRCLENGVECMPKYEFEEGLLRRIKPFKCEIAARSKEAEELLRD